MRPLLVQAPAAALAAAAATAPATEENGLSKAAASLVAGQT